MPDPILGEPVWEPKDARQTARDAARHTTYPGVAVASPRDVQRSCGRCGAGPLERCDRDCSTPGPRPARARAISRALVLLAVLIILSTVGMLWLAGAL